MSVESMLPETGLSLSFSGAVATGGTPQLILPQWPTRTYLLVQNTSAANLMFTIGPPQAVATVAGGLVTSVTVGASFGYTYAPTVQFVGGGALDNVAGYEFPPPVTVATALTTVAAGAVATSPVLSGGVGYVSAPYVKLVNAAADPYGSAAPSATVGFQLLPGGSMVMEGDFVDAGALAVYGATTGQTFFVRAVQ